MLQLRKPDDLHLHVRDGKMLQAVVPFSAKVFGRCIIMPNTVPPVTTVKQARQYKSKIEAAAKSHRTFRPLMVLYLTQHTTVEMVHEAKQSEFVVAFKMYPAGATTNSESGVTDIWKLLPVLKAMAEVGLLLLVHGEVTDADVDIFDREKVFIQRTMNRLVKEVPNLRIVMEHITTKDAVDFVTSAASNVAATITPQHIIMNRNAMFEGGLRPHYYCLPVLKAEEHRMAVLNAAISGNPKFFLGTDSAPHSKHKKESGCGCAGIFSSPVAMSIYAEAFEQAGALDKLEAFSCLHGARFYGLEPNNERIMLVKEEWDVPQKYFIDDTCLIPLRAGKKLHWKVKE